MDQVDNDGSQLCVILPLRGSGSGNTESSVTFLTLSRKSGLFIIDGFVCLYFLMFVLWKGTEYYQPLNA